MTLFLGIMAALFGIFTINENVKDKRFTYACCFGISVFGMVVYKLMTHLF